MGRGKEQKHCKQQQQTTFLGGTFYVGRPCLAKNSLVSGQPRGGTTKGSNKNCKFWAFYVGRPSLSKNSPVSGQPGGSKGPPWGGGKQQNTANSSKKQHFWGGVLRGKALLGRPNRKRRPWLGQPGGAKDFLGGAKTKKQPLYKVGRLTWEGQTREPGRRSLFSYSSL